jgi:C1A family cysteine protease
MIEERIGVSFSKKDPRSGGAPSKSMKSCKGATFKSFRTGAVPAFFAMVLTLYAQIASAQTSDDTVHGKGLLPTPPNILQSIPVLPTFRDWIPEKVDLSNFFPRPDSQRSQGSCVAWAVGYAARAYYSLKEAGRRETNYTLIPSPSYIYNSIMGGRNCDAGTYFERALGLLQDSGSASLFDYPYDWTRCDKPSDEIVSKYGGHFKIRTFHRLSTGKDILDDIKGQLSRNNPVVLGIMTTPIFDQFRGRGIYDVSSSYLHDNPSGRHAITAVGYDETKQAVRIINSWGTTWGDSGFLWISYETLRNSLEADNAEAYVMEIGERGPPTCSLVAEPDKITRGGTTQLRYSANNIQSGYLDHDLGYIGDAGSRSVSPTQTTVYTATFYGSSEQISCSAKVSVVQPEPVPSAPTISSFDATPQTMQRGQNVKLSWSATGSTSLRIDPAVGPVTGNSITISPRETTTYTLTATNAVGSTTSKATVTVKEPNPIQLPNLECSRVALSERAGKPVVTGFVRDEADVEKLHLAVPEAQIDVHVRPWPQCEALITLEKPLSLADEPKVSIRRTGGDTLTEGDRLVLEINTPSYPSYVHVAYIQADGSVLNLIQPGDSSFTAYRPRSKILIGDDDGGKRFRISKPFGREMVIVLAGKSPTFPEPRPKQETEREFLTALRRAMLYKTDPTAPDRQVAAAYDAIITKAKSAP